MVRALAIATARNRREKVVGEEEEMKAVILAGGAGTGLHPLTLTKPKPMLTLVNKPVIEHVVDYLVSHGLDDIVVTTTFLRETVIEHLEYKEDVRLTYPTEPYPLGTAGSVKNAGLEEEGEPFVVVHGDNITDMNLRGLIDFHHEAGGLVTIASTRVEDPWNCSVVTLEGDDSISRVHEKLPEGHCFSHLADTGAYVIDPKAMEFVPEGVPFDFTKDLFHLLRAKKGKGEGRIFRYETDADCFWADVGQPEGYMKAMEWVLKTAKSDVFVGKNAEIESSEITGPTVIGDNVLVEENCTVGPNAVLFEDVYIGKNSNLEQCFIGEYTIAEENASIKSAIIGANCELGKDVEVIDGKIWPSVTIPHRTTVDNTIKRFVRFDANGNGIRKEGAGTENGNLLRTVSDEEAFYFNMRKGEKIVHTGFVARSLDMFVDVLKKVDEKAIDFHFRDGYNDFAAWIRDVFNDEKLACRIVGIPWWGSSRRNLINTIQERLNDLKSGAGVDAS